MPGAPWSPWKQSRSFATLMPPLSFGDPYQGTIGRRLPAFSLSESDTLASRLERERSWSIPQGNHIRCETEGVQPHSSVNTNAVIPTQTAGKSMYLSVACPAPSPRGLLIKNDGLKSDLRAPDGHSPYLPHWTPRKRKALPLESELQRVGVHFEDGDSPSYSPDSIPSEGQVSSDTEWIPNKELAIAANKLARMRQTFENTSEPTALLFTVTPQKPTSTKARMCSKCGRPVKGHKRNGQKGKYFCVAFPPEFTVLDDGAV